MTPAEVCVSYITSFASGDPEAVTAHVTDDFVNEHTAALGSGCEGKAEYARRVPNFLASMPQLRYEVEDVTSNDDSVWIAYTLHTRANDRDIAVRGAMHFVVRDQLVAKRTDYWDSLVFQRQAGMT